MKMKNRILVVLVVLALSVIFIPDYTAFATGITPIQTYPIYAITITNSQSVATPAPFQQYLSLSFTKGVNASKLGFFSSVTNVNGYYQLSNRLYAWMESSSLANYTAGNGGTETAGIWVLLPNGIAASSSVTIYMVEWSSSFDGNYWGEAPTLSPSYGQYDNGPKVFSYYQNFNGTSLPSSLTSSGSGAISVNNGVTLSLSGSGKDEAVLSATASYQGLVEAGGISVTNGALISTGFSSVQSIQSYTLNSYYAYTFGYGSGYSGGLPVSVIAATASGSVVAYTTSGNNGANSIGLAWPATGTEYLYGGSYSSPYISWNDAHETLANSYVLLAIGYDTSNTGTESFTVHWFRLRAVPPKGIMPSISVSLLGYGSTTAPQYILSIYQEEVPTTLDSGITINIGIEDAAGYSYYGNTSVGFFAFNDSARPTNVIVSLTTTGRVYQNPAWTLSGSTYLFSTFMPLQQDLSILQTYIISFYSFQKNSYFSVRTLANSLVFNATIPNGTLSAGVPLLFGHQYTLTVTQPSGAVSAYSILASTSQSIGVQPTYPFKIYGTPTFSAIWQTGTSTLSLQFSDPNGIVGTGTAYVYSQSGSLLTQATITSGSWTDNIVGLPYSQGMTVNYQVTDPEQGAISGWQTVINSSTSNSNLINFNGVNDFGLSNIVAPGVGLTIGNLLSLAVLFLVAAVFSQKHSDIGALVIVVLAGLLVFFNWYTAPSYLNLSSILAASAFLAILLFIRRGSNPYTSMEES